MCWSPWGCKESDRTEWLNWLKITVFKKYIKYKLCIHVSEQRGRRKNSTFVFSYHLKVRGCGKLFVPLVLPTNVAATPGRHSSAFLHSSAVLQLPTSMIFWMAEQDFKVGSNFAPTAKDSHHHMVLSLQVPASCFACAFPAESQDHCQVSWHQGTSDMNTPWVRRCMFNMFTSLWDPGSLVNKSVLRESDDFSHGGMPELGPEASLDSRLSTLASMGTVAYGNLTA